MAAEANNSDKFPGVWLWDDPDAGRYTKFDAATSKQLEDALLTAIANKTKDRIEVPLNKGPFFGKMSQRGAYTCVITVNCSDPSRPIIKGARQTNNNTGYKRSIKREPALDPPLDADSQALMDTLDGKWKWKDDGGWKDYDLLDMAQIEKAFQERKPFAELSGSAYFAKRKGLYIVEFNYLSHPASAQQLNRKTKYGRWVRRTASEKAKKSEQNAAAMKKMMKKSDPFYPWRGHFCPLSIEDFEDQKCDSFKCSICLSEFEKKDLLESILEANDNLEKLADKKVALSGQQNQGDDEKVAELVVARSVNQHKFDLSGAIGLIGRSGDCVVGLSKGHYGLYFHAECIAQALDAKAQCPITSTQYGIVTGHQPDGVLYVLPFGAVCSDQVSTENRGSDDKTVKLVFEFPSGVQGEEHPDPGTHYSGDMREAFVPNNEEGRKYAVLIRLAFRRKLMFHIGRSLTQKKDNQIVFGSIHLKTKTNGGQEKHGWPDPKYFDNLKQELAVKGITEAVLEDENVISEQERDFIKNGFAESAVPKK